VWDLAFVQVEEAFKREDDATNPYFTILFQGRELPAQRPRPSSPSTTMPRLSYETLKRAITTVRKQDNWRSTDKVRLVFHMFKPPKDREAEAIKKTVDDLQLEDVSFLPAHRPMSPEAPSPFDLHGHDLPGAAGVPVLWALLADAGETGVSGHSGDGRFSNSIPAVKLQTAAAILCSDVAQETLHGPAVFW
jgi:hypothetical protein